MANHDETRSLDRRHFLGAGALTLGALTSLPDLAWAQAASTGEAGAKQISPLLAHSSAGFDLKNAPREVIDRARVAFIETVGVMLAGSRGEVAHLALDMVKLGGASQTASIVGQSLRTSPQLAALANGVAAHAMDYDFTFLSGQSVSPVIPALLPLAESTGASPADCVAAFIVGAEGAARLLRARPRLSHDGGWPSTGPVGSIAAAGGCAKLMKLPAEKIPDVLGISLSLASGVAVN